MPAPHSFYTFKMCAPDNPVEWPLWWLRYSLLRRRLHAVAAKHGRGTFEAGYEAAPLMYNVFRTQWIGIARSRVQVVNRTVTDLGDEELVSTEVAAMEPADAGAYKWALENGLV